jgi:hypothetical protein
LTPHQILASCSRLAAAIWALYALSCIPRYYIQLDQPPVDSRATVLTLVAAQIALCAFLWVFSTTVAQKILPRNKDASVTPVGVADWQILGVVCIGLWGLTRAIPDAMYWGVILQAWSTADYGLVALTIPQKARIASTILELGLALWLIFGARRVSSYLFGVRPSRASE